MSAPSGIVWGSEVGKAANYKGRIGIYTSISNTNTQTTVNVQAWVWTKWSASDSNNTLYYDAGTSVSSASTKIGSTSIDHPISTGTAWDTRNQTKLLDKTYTYTRSTSAVVYKVYAKLTGVDYIGSSYVMLANTKYTVPALPSYSITYNANGGSGAPSGQTKRYGSVVTLSSTKPTRSGYVFKGWATSATGNVAYAAGATYTSNATVTLYAVWEAITYIIKYDANGGTGAPANQTKSHGIALTLSSVTPIRKNHKFLGWATSASASRVSYVAGGTYASNVSMTLYAVWESTYTDPVIYNVAASRCDSSGMISDSGTYALVKFDWGTTYNVTSISITWNSTSAPSGSTTITASGTSGNINTVIGGTLSMDATYVITVTVSDSDGTSYAITTLNGSTFPIDYLPGGRGIGFGKPAELAGVADFGLAAKFNGPVFGNVLGLNKLPQIPGNSDFNDYKTTGSWAVYKTADAQTIANIPCPYAGRLEVNSSTGEGIRSEGWSYLRQRYIPYNEENATWERHLKRNDDNVWTYTDWWRSNLTPKAAAKVYYEPKVLWNGAYYMQASHTILLSDSIDNQQNGFVLIFSAYDTSTGAEIDAQFHSFFIPKQMIRMNLGVGYHFELAYNNYSCVCGKYLFIGGDRISGWDTNVAAGTNETSGVTYDNRKFVLRYVLGV